MVGDNNPDLQNKNNINPPLLKGFHLFRLLIQGKKLKNGTPDSGGAGASSEGIAVSETNMTTNTTKGWHLGF